LYPGGAFKFINFNKSLAVTALRKGKVIEKSREMDYFGINLLRFFCILYIILQSELTHGIFDNGFA
jgi:hypothetical protein